MPNDIIITPVSASIQFSGSAYASIKLTVDASGSLLVSGNSGSLFSITDNLSGSLMSVNTIAGLPIMEVFSDNRVNIGKYASEAIKVQSGGSDVAFGSGSVMFVTSSGRVGIGVNTPLNKLDVAGNISCSAITASFFGTSSWSTNSLTASSLISGNSYNITNLTASNISTSATGSFGTITSSGNIQVGPYNVSSITPTQLVFGNYQTSGTTRPQFIFNGVASWMGLGQLTTSSVNQLRLGTVSLPNTNWGTFGATAFNLMIDGGLSIGTTASLNNGLLISGSVGIGTATPSQKLTVSGTGTVVGRIESTSNAGARDAQLQLYVNNSGGADPAGSILFNASSSGGEISYGKIVVANTVAAAAGNGEMQFWTSLSGTATERMRINKDGNVGIGTTNPAYLLDVSGSSRHGYRSADTHQFTGSVSISGSLNATSSWATNSLTASSLVVGNSYTITNLTASNISASGTSSFGRVGIGTLNPSGSLDVSGSIYTSAKLVQRSTTQSLSGSASCSIDLSNGAVHILSLSSSAVISGLTYGNRDNNPHVNTIMLVLKYNGAATVTFTDVIWANAVTPSITAASGYADVFMLTSYQGGAVTPVWIGTVVSQALVSTNL